MNKINATLIYSFNTVYRIEDYFIILDNLLKIKLEPQKTQKFFFFSF